MSQPNRWPSTIIHTPPAVNSADPSTGTIFIRWRRTSGLGRRLQNRARLLELEARQLRHDLRWLAVTDIAQEVRLDPAVPEELGVDLGVVEPGHATHVESDGTRGEHEVGALERAVAKRHGLGQLGVGLIWVLHLGAVREELRQELVEARVVADDRRDG